MRPCLWRQGLSTAAGAVQVCLGLVREMADLDVDVSVGGGDPDAIEAVLQDLTADDGEHAAATDLSPGLAAAATEFDDNQSAFGGPEAGFLEGLVEGIEEHPDLSRLLTPMGLFRTCPHGRCSRGGNCLLRMATLRHEWLVQQVREAGRLRAATRAQDVHNLGRTYGGGEVKGAQKKANRAAAHAGSEAIGDATVDEAADYDFDGDEEVAAPAGVESTETDSSFLGSKHEARVAREMFVMDLMAHMHDPNFLVTGDQRGVCTDSMLAVAHVSNDYMFRRKGKGTAQESPSRMETLRTALEGRECTTAACDAARALQLLALEEVSVLDMRTGTKCSCRHGACSCQKMKQPVAARWREEWLAAKGQWKQQNYVLVKLLWDFATQQRSDVGFSFAGKLLGASAPRCGRAVAMCRQAVAAGHFDLLEGLRHGMVTVARLSVPHNKFPPALRAAVSEFLHLYTRTSPTEQWRRCTSQEYNSVYALHRGAHKEVAGAEAISLAAFQVMVADICKEEGIKGIKGENTDHNVCDDCKLIWFSKSSMQLLFKKTKADIRDWDDTTVGRPETLRCGVEFDAVEDLRRFSGLVQNLLNKVYDAEEEHNAKNRNIREWVGKLTKTAKDLYKGGDAAAAGGMVGDAGWRAARAEHRPLRSSNTIKVVSTDDMSAIQDPNTPLQSQQELYKFERILNGQYDMGRDAFFAYMWSLGHTAKTSNKVFTEIIAHLVETLDGERMIVHVLDCGPLNHGHLIATWLPQFLVDFGFCDFAFILFYQSKHGKAACDAAFGAIRKRLKKRSFAGEDAIAALISEIYADVQTGHKMQARILNPECQVDWEQALHGLYHGTSSSAWKQLQFKRFWPQLLVAARQDAVTSLPDGHAIREYVQRWGSGKDGVVRCWDDVVDGAKCRDFVVWKAQRKLDPVPRVTAGKETEEECNSLREQAEETGVQKQTSLDRNGKPRAKITKGLGGVNQLLVLGFNCWKVRKRKAYLPDLRACGGLQGSRLWHEGFKYDPAQGLIRARNFIVQRSYSDGSGPLLPMAYEHNMLNSRSAYAPVEESKILEPEGGSLCFPPPDTGSCAGLLERFNAQHADKAKPASVWDLALAVLQESRGLDADGLVDACQMSAQTVTAVVNALHKVPSPPARVEGPMPIAEEEEQFYTNARQVADGPDRAAVLELAPDACNGANWIGISAEHRRQAVFDAAHLLWTLREDASRICCPDPTEKKERVPVALEAAVDIGHECASQRGLIKIKNAFCVCECMGALEATDGNTRLRIVPHTGAVFDVERAAWDNAHALWNSEEARATSGQAQSWQNAMKNKTKLQALDDFVAAWRMQHAPTEGAIFKGGEVDEQSDVEVDDEEANDQYAE